MINKSIEDISHLDIQSLLDNRIDESDILDYKAEMIKKDNLMKHVCAFANTRGGDIIFGVKESGKGGYPTEIHGLDTSSINNEEIEQIILTNIVPRLDVKIKIIKIPDSPRSILLIRIPDSYLKPHQNNINKKFYRRFQFESSEMTEQEVCDSYRKRFRNHDSVEQYITKISDLKIELTSTDTIKANIIIIPSNIEHRLIETSDYEKFKWFRSIKMCPNVCYASSASFLPSPLEPFSYGLISNQSNPNKLTQVRIHRNGCIQRVEYFTGKKSDENYFPSSYFAVRLMQSLQFTNKTLQNYNYFGDVKIVVTITCPSKNILKLEDDFLQSKYPLDKINCKIEREYALQYVETSYEEITSSMMNEIFNHYGVVRSDMFDESGKIISNNL